MVASYCRVVADEGTSGSNQTRAVPLEQGARGGEGQKEKKEKEKEKKEKKEKKKKKKKKDDDVSDSVSDAIPTTNPFVRARLPLDIVDFHRWFLI